MNDSADTGRSDDTRRALTDQAAHLIEEAEALKSQVEGVPETVLSGRPVESDRTFKEIYALLALYDEKVFLPAMVRVFADEVPTVDRPDDFELLAGDAWNERSMLEIIERIQSSRSNLLARMADLSPDDWQRKVDLDGMQTDVSGLIYAIVRHDTDLLRTAAYRLYESRLTSRDDDLPK